MTLILDTPETRLAPSPPQPRGTNPAARQHPAGRSPLRLSPEQYWAMSEAEIVPDGTELVDGEIILMPPPDLAHSLPVDDLRDVFRPAWPRPKHILTQANHTFPSGWIPKPDLVLYDERPTVSPRTWPRPRLVIEVAYSTLSYDRGEKALRYARELVVEYWVIHVRGRRVLVFRDPVADAATAKQAWRTRFVVNADDPVSPLCIPNLSIKVADVLPEPPADEAD